MAGPGRETAAVSGQVRHGGRRTALLCAAAACLLTACVWAFLSLRLDFWFDINDDVMMKDILSGAYTGTPSSRNIQMLWPVSAFISLWYRAVRRIDWYGVFLLVCQFGSIAAVLSRALRRAWEDGQDRSRRMWTALAAGAVLAAGLSLLWPHLVFVQYTITTGMLCCAALFLLMTADLPGDDAGAHVVRRVFAAACREKGAVLLIWLAFFIRTEMTLLMLPLVLTGLAVRFLKEGRLFTRRHILAAAGIVAAMGAGMLAGKAADVAACASPQWREFRSFFDARTELYDFYLHDIPAYDEARDLYDSLGMGPASAELLTNYNFGLDERIDADTLWTVRARAAQIHAGYTSPAAQLRRAVRAYLSRIRHMKDGPWSVIAAVLYALAAALLIRERDARRRTGMLAGLALTVFVRTGLWMFILYRGRDPERITHSLYLLEFMLVGGIVFFLARRQARGGLYPALLILAAAALLPAQVRAADAEHARRLSVNEAEEAYLAYCAAHPDDLFLTDVYSTVSYTQRMFAGESAGTNYDLMGGWVCKSPLQREKFRAFGISSMEEALAGDPDVYFVTSPGRDTAWLADYYLEKGVLVSLRECDIIGKDWAVYEVTADAVEDDAAAGR